jgi:hypothetical protein
MKTLDATGKTSVYVLVKKRQENHCEISLYMNTLEASFRNKSIKPKTGPEPPVSK